MIPVQQLLTVFAFCLMPMLIGTAVGILLSRLPASTRLSLTKKNLIVLAATIITWLVIYALFLSLDIAADFRNGFD